MRQGERMPDDADRLRDIEARWSAPVARSAVGYADVAWLLAEVRRLRVTAERDESRVIRESRLAALREARGIVADVALERMSLREAMDTLGARIAELLR